MCGRNRKIATALLGLTATVLLVSGCWDNAELTEYSFVQAVAVDPTENNRILLTTLHINPSSGNASMEDENRSGNGTRSFLVRTEDDTVFEAIRDTTIHIGRKGKFDHMRIILIAESFLRKRDIGDVMDFFTRDHEPRGTILIAATRGEAGRYLETNPLIESTVGEQFRTMETVSSRFSAKAIRTMLLDLTIDLKSPLSVAMIPYLSSSRLDSGAPSLAGLAVLKRGRLAFNLTPSQTQRMLMLRDKYESGILEIACKSGDRIRNESFEVIRARTRIYPTVENGRLRARIVTEIAGSIGELHCTTLQTEEDERRYVARIESKVQKEMTELVAFLQRKKVDAIGLGNLLYAKHPRLWKQWEKEWDDRFAEASIECDVQIRLLNSGTNIARPYSRYKEE